MNLALPLMVLGPAGAAVLILAGGGGAKARRGIALAGLGAAIGATIFVLITAIPEGSGAARGLETDAWRAGLALAALVVAAAGLPGSERGSIPMIAHLAAAAAAVGAFVATDVATVGGFFVAATGASLLAAVSDGSRAGLRAAGWFVLSDVLAVGGLLLAADGGMRVPPTLTALPAALLLVSAAIRTGAVPLVRSFADVTEAGSLTGSIALGPMRAQGLLVAGWVALAGGGAAEAMAIAGAILAATSARRAARESSGGAATAAVMGLVLCGLGVGGVTATWGAVLLAAGMFAGGALALLGGSGFAAGSIAVAPLGATLPGAVMVASASLARGLSDATDLATGAAAALALVWLVAAGTSGARGTTARAHPLWLVLPSLAALTIAVVPGRALRAIAVPLAPFLGAGRPLGELPGTVPDDLGILFAVAAVGGLTAATQSRRLRVRVGDDAVAGAGSLHVPRVALVVLAGAAVGALGLLWVGIRRGFI